jgi:Domain of unknown function (DUF4178)
MKTSTCPNCGAQITFRWSSAVQTTCEYCRSILVRHDVDLAKVGHVSDLPPDSSPIQVATEGVYGNKPFVVVGRIVYEYELGTWNEWHLIFNDSTSGWLSDDMADYEVSVLAKPSAPLPEANSVKRGQAFQLNNVRFQVTNLTRARYRGVEGELPFEYWGKDTVLFADLRSADGRFATIDYSESHPLLFLGESVEFDSLQLKNLRRFEGWS